MQKVKKYQLILKFIKCDEKNKKSKFFTKIKILIKNIENLACKTIKKNYKIMIKK